MSSEEAKDLNVRISILENKFATFTDDTREWRQRLWSKIEEMSVVLNKLPCEVRLERYKTLSSQIVWLWRTISAVTLIIMGAVVSHILGVK